MFGEAMRESAVEVGGRAREAQGMVQDAARAAVAFSKRNALPVALAGAGAACAGLALAFFRFGGRTAIKEAIGRQWRRKGEGDTQLPEQPRAEALTSSAAE
jgi:hypothetical protein